MTISNATSGGALKLAAVLQEATETAAQTKTEAAKGDRQAMRKLARAQEAQSAETAAPAPTATGTHSRALDAKA